jgi:hypothetical protein
MRFRSNFSFLGGGKNAHLSKEYYFTEKRYAFGHDTFNTRNLRIFFQNATRYFMSIVFLEFCMDFLRNCLQSTLCKGRSAAEKITYKYKAADISSGLCQVSTRELAT